MRASQNPASQPLPLLFKLQKEKEEKKSQNPNPKPFKRTWSMCLGPPLYDSKLLQQPLKSGILIIHSKKKAILAGLQCNNREQYFIWCYLWWSGSLTIRKGATPRLSLSHCVPLFSHLAEDLKAGAFPRGQVLGCWGYKDLVTSQKASPGRVPQAKEKNGDTKTLQCRKMLEGWNWVGRQLPRRKECLFFRYQRDVSMAAQLRGL